MIETTRIARLTKRAALLSCVLLGFAAGCGSDSRPPNPPPAQPKTSSSSANTSANTSMARSDSLASPTMDAFRADLVQSQHQIDSVTASLADMTSPSQTDLRAAYDKYCDQLARMQQHSETMRREADAMRASRDSYFGTWEQKLTDIDNPTIRASAEARRRRLRDAHERITTTSLAARDAYQPFMKDLQDVRKYLAADLSKSSVADLGDASRKVQGDGAAVRDKIGAVIRVLDEVQGTN